MPQLDPQDRSRDNPYKVEPEDLIYLYGYLAVARYPSWVGAGSKYPLHETNVQLWQTYFLKVASKLPN
jgi:hypothetical protein